MYQLIASNLEQDRKKERYQNPLPDRKHSEGDSVLPKDHNTGVWDPRYNRDY